MRRIIAGSLSILTFIGTISNHQPVKADTVIITDSEEEYSKNKVKYCYPVVHKSISEDAAFHPRAYRDGYRQGKESAIKGKSYKPRSAGGEFGRGFEDGYFGRRFTGQRHTIPNKVNTYTTRECQTYSY